MKPYWLFVSALAILFDVGGISLEAIADPISTATTQSSSTTTIAQLPTPILADSPIDPQIVGMKRCGRKIDRMLFRSLLPADNVAKTALAAPNLWFYIPQQHMVGLKFSLFKDNDDEPIYFRQIDNIEERNGLFHVSIPANLLEPDQTYWWDLTLRYDTIDRSADVFLFGRIDYQNSAQISLQTDPATLAILAETLMDSHSFLSLEEKTAKKLAEALQTKPTDKTIRKVEKYLREHLIERHNTYAQTNAAILELLQNPQPNAEKLASLQTQQQAMQLELAQLSSFFGLWGDTTHFLAMNRSEHPEEWQMLMRLFFQGPDIIPVTDEAIATLTNASVF